MNILHMKYAYEVSKAGSLSKAAETLVIAAPNLSRSIKELEAELGITIFDRTSKGMTLTADGEVFMDYARNILSQIENLERVYKNNSKNKKVFSVSVPRASYISDAFAKFCKTVPYDTAEIFYHETGAQYIINNVLRQDSKMGIIRYNESLDSEYKQIFEDKGLTYELISEFEYNLITSADSPLALKDNITESDLKQCVEISYKDDILSFTDKQNNTEENSQILVMERASRYDLLAANNNAYMLESPVPESILKKNSLVQKKYKASDNIYKDVLIYKNNYKLTELDNRFITELCDSRRRSF